VPILHTPRSAPLPARRLVRPGDPLLPISGKRLPRRGHVHQHVLFLGTAAAVGHGPTYGSVLTVVFDFFHCGPLAHGTRHELVGSPAPAQEKAPPKRGKLARDVPLASIIFWRDLLNKPDNSPAQFRVADVHERLYQSQAVRRGEKIIHVQVRVGDLRNCR
jgi:hypothetical protein